MHDVRYWPKADTPHYSIRPRFWLHGTSPKYLSNLARVGTKYVLRGCGPLVRRYVEFPNGRKIKLATRKASPCTCVEREQTNIVPDQVADAVEFRRRIFA